MSRAEKPARQLLGHGRIREKRDSETWRTIFFAASMLSSSMTPRGITPFSRRYEAVTSW